MKFLRLLFLLFFTFNSSINGFTKTTGNSYSVDLLSISKLEYVMVYSRKTLPDQGNCYYELIINIINESDSKLFINPNEIVLEGNGYFKSKDYLSKDNISLTEYSATLKIGKGKTKRINLYYEFPLELHPNNLIIENRQMMNISHGQKDDIYLTYQNQVTTNTNEAAYRREFYLEGGKWIVRDYYYPENKLQMEFSCNSIYPMEKEGPFKEFYLNGNVKEKGEFKRNFPRGYVKTFYDNGNERSVKYYDLQETRFLHFYDESGQDLLDHGTGVFSYYNEQGNKTWYKVEDSLAVASYEVTGHNQDTIFFVTGSTPRPEGGMRAFYMGIQRSLRYPAEARRKGIEGKVFVQFIVNKEGKLEDIMTVKGIGYGCDAAAEKAVGESQAWIPAEFEGKKVKVRMILPITFKLG